MPILLWPIIWTNSSNYILRRHSSMLLSAYYSNHESWKQVLAYFDAWYTLWSRSSQTKPALRSYRRTRKLPLLGDIARMVPPYRIRPGPSSPQIDPFANVWYMDDRKQLQIATHTHVIISIYHMWLKSIIIAYVESMSVWWWKCVFQRRHSRSNIHTWSHAQTNSIHKWSNLWWRHRLWWI